MVSVARVRSQEAEPTFCFSVICHHGQSRGAEGGARAMAEIHPRPVVHVSAQPLTRLPSQLSLCRLWLAPPRSMASLTFPG